jgi:hypothetical protein
VSTMVSGDAAEIQDVEKSVKTFMHKEWEALSDDQQDEVLSKFSVHECGEPTSPIMPDIKSWDDTRALRRWFNLELPYCAASEFLTPLFLRMHRGICITICPADLLSGDDGNKAHRQATLNDFLECRKDKETVHVLNFLDIPMAHRFVFPPRSVPQRHCCEGSFLTTASPCIQRGKPHQQPRIAELWRSHLGHAMAYRGIIMGLVRIKARNI